MHYELVTTIRPQETIFQKQKARLLKENGQILSISPSTDFYGLLDSEKISGLNIIDSLTQRTHDPETFLFFDKAPVPKNAAIFMNEDFTISVLNEGEEIGRIELYPNTRRHVRSLTFTNLDGTTDYLEEFASDGKRYSRIYYHANQAQEIAYLNDTEFPVVSYFFYEGAINEVMVRDPETREITAHFDNLDEFIQAQVAAHLTAEDTVGISYLGMEMNALAASPSHNTFWLEEDPLDENGNVKGNLQLILEDKIAYIQEVKVTRPAFETLVKKGVSMQKVSIIDSQR